MTVVVIVLVFIDVIVILIFFAFFIHRWLSLRPVAHQNAFVNLFIGLYMVCSCSVDTCYTQIIARHKLVACVFRVHVW